jgi:hypothetical protein
MPFNIDTFKSEIEQNGYMKNNHFRIALRPPRIFNDVAAANALSFRAESIKIPGVQILSADNITSYISFKFVRGRIIIMIIK